MMNFYQFLENIKNKTDLTPWLVAIKSKPKEEMTYFTLADFLGDNGGLDAMVGDFLRRAVQSQKIEDRNEEEQFHNESKPLTVKIKQEFDNLGIGNQNNPYSPMMKVPKLTQSHGIDSQGKYRWAQIGSDSLKKMSLTLPQDRDRKKIPGWVENPRIKTPQDNNVAIHDLADRNTQLFYIFQIAQRIANRSLILSGNEKDPCDLYGSMHIGQLIGSLIGNHWADEDQQDIVRYVPDYQVIFPYMKQSWNCCSRYDADKIEELKNELSHIRSELEYTNQNRGSNWIASRMIIAWLRIVQNLKPGECDSYRSELGKIISRYRNQEKAHEIFRRAQEV